MAYTKAEKEGWLPVSKEEKPSAPTFDLDKINMVQLADDLSSMLNRPAPKTWIGQWFRSVSITLDTERVRKIAEYVESVRDINGKITNMQAELVLSPTILEELISGHFIEARRLGELQEKQHRDMLQAIDDQAEARQIQLQEARARARQEGAKASLIEKSLENPDIITALLTIKAMDPTADAQVGTVVNNLIEQRLKREELEIKNIDLDNKIKEQALRKEQSQADLDEFTKDETIRPGSRR